MLLKVAFFLSAYLLYISVLCRALRQMSQQIEIDYPFTSPPPTVGHSGTHEHKAHLSE